MSQPEHESIEDQIKNAQITASPELRARVRAIAAQSPASSSTPARREWPWRRGLLAAAAVAVAVTLAVGLTDSGSKPSERNAASPPVAFADGTAGGAGGVDTVTPTPSSKAPKGGAASIASDLPSTPGRAQLYDAELTLKISDLSTATKRALRLTRDFNGYVRSVDYGSGTERGSAYLVLRVPIGSVQAAIVKFSALGRILDQHVSIQDVQHTVDKRFRLMQAQRDQITKLQSKLKDSTLSTDERTALTNQLIAAQHLLLATQKKATALARQTSYATVELDLRQNPKAAVVVPHDPGRIGRAFHRSGQILADEAKVLIYVLLVGMPLFLLGALLFGSWRVRRRREEQRILAA
jgi:hypothetical protein